ncbi:MULTISPECIES: TadE/TadG family type IV pilus assembly protein [unclassified Variovorax]|uniref:TadE/TadG family type IV pilus assembly protein n=1 Tax=unclassified Variovorax TaxID=663243 RepID=UPI000F7E2883|nr:MULTISPECIES: TadE/TadG family type IV pilus assembly protein [unclassified Variovorax]RSZ29946.1 pilus assembly protein [Variovorax sp. 553]RSZ30501.1 pilus assembly protein [Variovorax sp. 679]
MKSKRESGAAAVEFALVLPFFLLVFSMIVDLSLAFYDKAVITNASREAARAGVVLRSPKLSSTDLQAIVTQYCDRYLIAFGGPSPVTTTSTGAGGAFGSSLTVNVSYRYTGLGWGALLGVVMGPFNLSARTIMVHE